MRVVAQGHLFSFTLGDGNDEMKTIVEEILDLTGKNSKQNIHSKKKNNIKERTGVLALASN